ncbi:hypothetical protein BLA60_29285 [Actinophytocola xinjiangensis]|uniref:Uncharacterized protein n=1 Tax=Actinophytocola xinjiangensis TaxID=485602 RepID=A0A7Z1AVY2_9PSEU|nr:hypothetical protein BLA60_29285 [Actinophytocola xinjiangensis]
MTPGRHRDEHRDGDRTIHIGPRPEDILAIVDVSTCERDEDTAFGDHGPAEMVPRAVRPRTG